MLVLGTKLRPPTVRPNLVDRERLVRRLNTPGDSLPRLVLVSAPAGFGKTTLLAQWLDPTSASSDGPSRVAWLSLDAADTDPHRFAVHLIRALQRSEPKIGLDALALLEVQSDPLSEPVLVSIINDLDALVDSAVLVFDDYHHIDDRAVHDAVAFLLDSLSPHVTLVISTRADPPLPLPRLRARGQLLEIRAADLRFTVDEAASFLTDTMELRLDRAHVVSLDKRIEGWAAGLQTGRLGRAGPLR